MKSLLEKKDDALPETVNFTYDEFEQVRDEWVLWRSLGHIDASGAWIPPITFDRLDTMPLRKLKIFLELDANLAKLAKQRTQIEKKYGK